MPTTNLSAKDLATQCDTDPKTLRKFLREHLRAQEVETPGQGGRYNFTPKEGKALAKAFKAWAGGKTERAATKAASKVEAEELIDEVDEIEDIEDIDLDAVDDPSEDELEALEVSDDVDDEVS
jgi:hypothetical protein